MLSYFLKCRKNTESKNPKTARIKHGIIMLLWKCAVFDSKKLKCIAKQEASVFLSSLGINAPLSKITLVGPLFLKLLTN